MAASSAQPARRPADGPIAAELVCIGSELTSGHVLNTNVCYLSQQLAALGIHTLFHTSVGDEAGPMAEALRTASRRADVVIVTGGLGPTADDFTRDIIAEVAGKKLLRHEPSVEAIRERFRRFGSALTENNLQQALFPEGAEVIPNGGGTAPGFALRLERAVVIALPGVPREMQGMFEEWVAPYLRKSGYASGVRVTRQLHCFGAGESAIDARIRHLMATDRNPVVALLAQGGTITVKLTASGPSPAEASRLLDDTEQELQKLLGDLIFGRDGEGLEDAVARLLREQGKTLAVAESCTGGLVSSLLTRVPGVSASFLLGVVAYSDKAKTALLEVPADLIRAHGAVSAEVARAMAEGVRRRASADLACALTGIAGPSGGTSEKPVGLVWMAVADADGTEVFQRNFRGARTDVQLRAAKAVLAALRQKLLADKA